MRNFALIILACGLLFSAQTVQAQQSPQAIFDEANTLFENGELPEALSMYRSIIASGQVSGALYLNMGIAAVQMDSMGLAKYYFLKSHSFEETQSDAASAIEYVNSQFSRRSAALPKLPWDRAVEWINNYPGAPGLFIIGFILTILGLIVLYLKWFQKLPFQNHVPVTASFLAAGIILILSAFYADYVDQRYDEAVLIASSQRVLQQPSPESPLISIAYEGYDLNVDHWRSQPQEEWLYVRLGNGQFGWIENDGIRIL